MRRLAFASLAALALCLLSASSALASTTIGPPGSVPSGWKPVYNDSWRGWPVKPFTGPHPIRGTFWDPRSGYHFGVDINVNDAKPEEGAPAGSTHRVYAIEGGSVLSKKIGASCSGSRLRVAHFAYWHINATVSKGKRIYPGDMLGWTCTGNWHIHVSEYQKVSGVEYAVNPIRRGHKIPLKDGKPPVIHEITFNKPAATSMTDIYGGKVAYAPPAGRALPLSELSGNIDIRAWIEDEPSPVGGWWKSYPRLHAPQHPYEVRVRIRSAAGKTVYENVVFRADRLPDKSPWYMSWTTHFAPQTRQNHPAQRCVSQTSEPCDGIYWIRLFNRPTAYWNSKTVANGSYTLIVTALDTVGNYSQKSVGFTVRN